MPSGYTFDLQYEAIFQLVTKIALSPLLVESVKIYK